MQVTPQKNVVIVYEKFFVLKFYIHCRCGMQFPDVHLNVDKGFLLSVLHMIPSNTPSHSQVMFIHDITPVPT